MTQPATMLPVITGLFVAALLLHAAARDVATRMLPNAHWLALTAVGLFQRLLAHQFLAGLVAFILVFSACLVLWKGGLLGGGDVKLLAACACLVPAGEVPALLSTIMICGGGLGCLYLVARRCAARFMFKKPGRWHSNRILRAELWRIRRHAALPYGVAISAGTLLHLFGA